MTDSSAKVAITVRPGSLVGRYRIEHLLGSGGMAEVFYAVHEDLHRPAALKILRASLATDQTNLQRFLNEARAAAALIHPNIVQVYDVGRDGDLHYIAQEFVPGTNLRQFLAAPSTPSSTDMPELPQQPGHSVDRPVASGGSGARPIEVRDPDTGDRQLAITETLSILLQVLAALNKSASSGIVHRDIKPENIMLNEDGEVKVADFGLARTLLGDDPKLTRAGTTLGTPMYMSPEQIQGGTVDIRSDLYSLGVTLYHMLAGRPPFLGDTQLALAMKHTQAEVPDILQFRAEIPKSLVMLLERLLEKSPQDRFESPAHTLAFLQQHRGQDLSQLWPEQTVPLPRVSLLGNPPVMEATLKLQAMLNRRGRLVGGSKWWKRLAAVLLILAAFVAGMAMTLADPFAYTEVSQLYRGVPRQDTVQAQYHYALLNENRRVAREDKWRAVEHYFPKDEGGLNRSYAAMASLQLARALHRKGDSEAAKRELDRTVNDSGMDEFYKVYALLEKAMIEDELGPAGQEEQLNAAVDSALDMWRAIKDEDKKERLSNQLNELVKSRDVERTARRWLAGTEAGS